MSFVLATSHSCKHAYCALGMIFKGWALCPGNERLIPRKLPRKVPRRKTIFFENAKCRAFSKPEASLL